jgi:hypothetical protein
MSARRAAIVLFALGSMQMAGDLLHLPVLRGIGAATGLSPAPKVFSAVRGLETYSSRFFLECDDPEAGGSVFSRRITPELYARLRGPYNRRNVFGAVLAYGPLLASDARTRPIFDDVARFALCGEAPLLRELGVRLPPACGPLRVRLEPRPGAATGDLPLVLEPACR